jgi:hypothetical protein
MNIEHPIIVANQGPAKLIHETREAWLRAGADVMTPWFDEAGKPLTAPIRLSIGFPSARGLSTKNRAIGECWAVTSSKDKTAEIFISPLLDDPLEVLAVVLHEMAHAVLGPKVGHRKPFAKLVKTLGLDGKATATTPGLLFMDRIKPVLADLGPLPHHRLTPMSGNLKKQTTRMLKCACDDCGYTIRISKKWLEVGPPICPTDRKILVAEEVEPEDDA